MTAPGGVTLATDVHLPADGRPAPVVLVRTPYGRALHEAEGRGWASRGYVFIAQDVRGRGDSEGAWWPYQHERADGACAVRWAGDQPWCDGRVVPAGGSYAAFAAWSAALGAPGRAAAVMSLVPAMGTHAVNFAPSGPLALYRHVWWWAENAGRPRPDPQAFAAMLRADPHWFDHLPVLGLGDRLAEAARGWRDVVEAGPTPPHGPGAVSDAELVGLDVPTLHVGGWYDAFVRQTLHQFDLVGSGCATRPHRQLVVGPWTHQLGGERRGAVAGRRIGPDGRAALGPMQVSWLDSVLGGVGKAPTGARVSIFTLGRDRWSDHACWPPPGTAPVSWFLAVGAVLAATPGEAGVDTYDYDPLRPFRSPLPGLPPPRPEEGMALQYLSAPLTTDLTLHGVPSVVLWVATDAPDTDVVAVLSELRADGTELALGRGIIDTARQRRPGDGRRRPGEAVAYGVDLEPLALRLDAGSRLRLQVASSYFPEFARNLNTGADRHRSAVTAVATQQVWRGAARPSALVLPVEMAAPDAGRTR